MYDQVTKVNSLKMNPENNNINGTVNLVNKATDIVKTTFKGSDSLVVTNSQKLDDIDLVKHTVNVEVNGKKEKVNE